MRHPRLFLALLLILTAVGKVVAEPAVVGIGIALVIQTENTGPVISYVLPDSPAARAKVTAGMIVSRADGILTAGMALEDCVSLLRGAAGTDVNIEVTNAADGKVTPLTLKREKLDLSKKPPEGAVVPGTP